MSSLPEISEDLQYLFVVVGLFIVPRILQRFRIPSAITCVGLGALLGLGFGLFHTGSVVPLLSTLGIVALFLFAGLEVDFSELRQGIGITVGHLVLQTALLTLGTFSFGALFQLDWRPALLFALAVFTPSTGFILDSLPGFGLTEQQRFWVKTKAIASELVALAALFFTVQSHSVSSFALSSLALTALVFILPWVFQLFASRILPFAPKSEFAFLIILALICAYATRHLGVYYLVGAFVVGVTAVRLRQRIPALASERLLVGIELFASFFIPFYFFKAGLHLDRATFGWKSLLLGCALTVVAVPLRVTITAAFRRIALNEQWKDSTRVGLSLVPTLVFTLVLADILRDRYALAPHLFGGLVIFALTNTVIPGLILRTPPPEFDEPEAPRMVTSPTVAGTKTASSEAVGLDPSIPLSGENSEAEENS